MRYRSAGRLSPADIGKRVTVRHRLAEGGSADVIGTLEGLDGEHVTVRRADGDPVTIPVAQIVAARVISPPRGASGP